MNKPVKRKFKRLFIVRHGESEGNIDVTKYDTILDSDISLTDNGYSQAQEAGKLIAEKLAGWANHKKVISPSFFISPYLRTKQTHKGLVSGMHRLFVNGSTTPIEDPRLREQEFRGKLTVFDYNQFKEHAEQGRFWYRYEHGESIADTYDRSCHFLMDRIDACNQCDDVAIIVSHGMTSRCLLMRLLNLTVEEFLKLRNPKNCQVIHLEVNDFGEWELKSNLERRK